MPTFDLPHYRRFLNDLRTAVAARTTAEAELAAFDESAPASSEADRDDALRRLATALESNLADADARRAAARETVEGRFGAVTESAEREYRSTISAVRERADAERADAERQFEENRWMLSSLMDDDSESSPKRQYESLKEQLAQSREQLNARWEALKARREAAVGLLDRRRQSTPAELTTPTPSRDRKSALERFDAAELIVMRQLERLRRQVVPRLFVGAVWLPLFLLLWGGLFVGLYLGVSPESLGLNQVTDVGRVLLAGGAALAVCGLIFGMLWGVAVRRSASAWEPLQAAAAEARAQRQQWQALAQEELARRERDYKSRHAAIVEHREKTARELAADRERTVAELTAARDAALREPEELRDAVLQEETRRRDAESAALDAEHERETAALRTRHAAERLRIVREHDEAAASRQAHWERLWVTMRERWQASLAELHRRADDLREAAQEEFSDCETVLDEGWSPAGTIPAGVRLGDYEIDLKSLPGGVPHDPRLRPASTIFCLPAVLPFPDSPSLLVEAEGSGRGAAADLLLNATLRLLASLPAGKARLTVIDPVGLGERFSSLMHLADYDELLISGRIWTDPAAIDRQLADLTAHMENVFQKYLRHEFETIEDYNVHAGEVAEPYRILVVADFPAGFSERAAQRLASVAASGPRCGVYVLAGFDPSQPRPHGFDPSVLEAAATTLRWREGRFVNPAFDAAAPLRPDAPPPPPTCAAIVRRIGQASMNVRRVEVPFRRIAPAEAELWTADSHRTLECPLGRSGATRLQPLRLGVGTSQHVLVAGKTGSGKSTLLHVLITNLALRYAPDELEFYLIDFKKGVEFKTYAAHGLPHARVIAIESDREFGVSVLERLDAVLKERGDLFRGAGVQDLAAFRVARPDVPMPRVLFVVDEFQEFFTEDDRYAQTAGLLLDRLVRQGRAFGMHVLLGSQTLGGAYSLARTTLGQMAVRIALQCGEADAHLILSEENSAARLLTRPGEAIYNDAGGLTDGNSPFQSAWLGDDERDVWLDKIADLAAARGLPPTPPLVFEGNVPADPARNAELLGLIAGDRQGDFAETVEPAVWIGDAVSLTGPLAVTFRRQAGANLLLVGPDPAAAAGILSSALVSLALQAAETDDGAPTVLLATADAAGDRWRATLDALGGRVRPVSVTEIAGTLEELSVETARRQDAPPGEPAPPRFLVVDDLARFRDLKKADDDFGFGGFGEAKAVGPGKRFADLLRNGPAVGVHLLVWCDSYNAADRALGRALLKEFEPRVAFAMSAADSSSLIDSPAASRLGPNRAVLYRDERGTSEKFRPYGPPSLEWLVQVGARMQTPEPTEQPESTELDIDQWVVL